MTDDQGQKITSIDDLVNELTKKSSSGPVPSFPKPPASPSQMTPSVSAPQPEIPKPRFTPPPPPSTGGPMTPRPAPVPILPAQSVPKPTPTPPPPIPPRSTPLPSTPSGGGGPAPIKEYQSSIRTMKEDISTLKQGQKPAGINVPRKVETPVPAAPTIPKPTAPPLPGQFKVPSVSLGQAEKTGPLPQSKQPISPLMPIGKPAPVLGKPQIYAPPLSTGGMSSNRNRLFGLIAGVAVLFGILYWFLIIRPQTPQIAEETPTPTPTAAPIQDLTVIFSGTQTQTALLMTDITADDFAQSLKNGTINSGKFIKIYTSENDTSSTIIKLLDNFILSYPLGLKGLTGQDYLLLIYGQKEFFDTNGQPKVGVQTESRIISINEVKSASVALQLGKEWELNMSESLKELFSLDVSKQASPDFLDNTYRGVSIRYKNFPYSDRSIDYAIILASNGKSYLVITNSRESMYSAIDKLVGF